MTNGTVASPSRRLPVDDEPASIARAARQALDRSGGPIGIAVAAAPTVAFVVANALSGLTWAFIALAGAAPVVLGVRLARRESLRAALFGLAVAAVCALVAAVAGEARAFFLLPTVLPAAFMLLFLGSLLVRRPLTGLAGGPRDWRRHGPLRRVYTVTTLVAVAINLVNFVLRTVLYSADQLAVLAVLEVATAPVLLTLAAFTLVAARRAGSQPTAVP
ncbi:DUF3159 domain-containing protein [Actinomadura alba]|uniref:DUF3159 domain-containing protein n=1 Tax=Actinomadura alba TaxID=406431 RepID=A0ABR7LYS3_9ACTN|nr:DUF3159 domain-containing protein [Actinomadura alba]MBC6469929.1 DUF3159 domain-containing protein [Actinomadura alba]